MKILIVDDAKLQRFNVSRHLVALGHEVVEAVDGEEGVAKASDPTISLVISDLLMPRRDGFGLADALRSARPELPIIICSADIQTSSRQRCMDLGVRVFLNKPLDRERLVDALKQCQQVPS
jgi:CheY-like chemotaxis protein